MAKKLTYEELEQRVKELENEAFERKHADDVLLEYRKAVEGSEELITAVDRQYVYSLANDAFLRYHCLNQDQVIGRNIVQVIDKKIFESIIKPNAERCFKGKPVDFEMKQNYPEYGERYMLVSNYPLKNDDGEVTGMVSVARDVTVSKMAAEGLRESEEKYRSLVEATSDWIWEVDNDGVYTYTNFKVKDMLGYEPEEIIGKTPFDFMVPNEQERLTEWLRDILESRKPFEGMENTNIHKDGRHVLLETSGVPIFDPDGNLLGYRGIDRNITRRKLAEKALQKVHIDLERRVEERTAELVRANEKLNQEIAVRKQVEEELKESTKRIQLFAYSVSHDLKSPTMSIYGLTKRFSMLYRNILDEKGQIYCDQILKASDQIARLAEHINVYMSTKEAPITIENVNLKEIFRMVREEIAPQLSIRKVKWSQSDYLPEIKADRLSIVRVIRNLVDNALKYGGDDLSEISIGYKESDEFHILSVMDDGIGLKAGDSKEIFDTFKRTQTSRGIEGAGLGLAIVKEIAERHAGKIWMKPGPEKGI